MLSYALHKLILPLANQSPGISRMTDFTLRDVPKLKVSRQPRELPLSHDPTKEHLFRYKAKKHQSLPHVMKFSGGRSSGLLLFTLLENRLLDPDRGDVIVFNNTSAEHPDTYRFVRDCMRAARKYEIPFFHIEFQTYEDARRGEWTRIPTYRLVNDQQKSPDNPDGFHWRGEIFEELLSWTGYVPNQFNRTCTKHLKLGVTRDFLKDWLASNPSIARLGHYGDSSRIEPDVSYERHLQNQGAVPKEIFLKKRSYVWQRPHFRPEQQYIDFCSDWKPFTNPTLKNKTFGGKAWFGKGGIEYISFIGLRGDEPRRVQRVEDRSASTTGFEGEHVYMPLADMAVSRDDVNAFWDRQEWNLSLPENMNLSNCVYCFLKGSANLQMIHARMKDEQQIPDPDFGSIEDTPSDLAWWSQIEADYSRDLQAEKRKVRSDTTHIGFFGTNRFSYDHLGTETELDRFTEGMLPCDCTD